MHNLFKKVFTVAACATLILTFLPDFVPTALADISNGDEITVTLNGGAWTNGSITTSFTGQGDNITVGGDNGSTAISAVEVADSQAMNGYGAGDYLFTTSTDIPGNGYNSVWVQHFLTENYGFKLQDNNQVGSQPVTGYYAASDVYDLSGWYAAPNPYRNPYWYDPSQGQYVHLEPYTKPNLTITSVQDASSLEPGQTVAVQNTNNSPVDDTSGNPDNAPATWGQKNGGLIAVWDFNGDYTNAFSGSSFSIPCYGFSPWGGTYQPGESPTSDFDVTVPNNASGNGTLFVYYVDGIDRYSEGSYSVSVAKAPAVSLSVTPTSTQTTGSSFKLTATASNITSDDFITIQEVTAPYPGTFSGQEEYETWQSSGTYGSYGFNANVSSKYAQKVTYNAQIFDEDNGQTYTSNNITVQWTSAASSPPSTGGTPTVSLSASLTSLTAGQSSILTATATNSSDIIKILDESGDETLNGNNVYTDNNAGDPLMSTKATSQTARTVTYEAELINPATLNVDAVSNSVIVTWAAGANPTITFTASPTTLQSGNESLLTYNVANMQSGDYVKISSAGNGSDEWNQNNITSSTESYGEVENCVDGQNVSVSVVAMLYNSIGQLIGQVGANITWQAPQADITISASPQNMVPGQASQITYTVFNDSMSQTGDTVTIIGQGGTDAWNVTKQNVDEESYYQTENPSAGQSITTNYTAELINAAGNIIGTASTSVSWTNAWSGTINLSANPTYLATDTATTLTASVTEAIPSGYTMTIMDETTGQMVDQTTTTTPSSPEVTKYTSYRAETDTFMTYISDGYEQVGNTSNSVNVVWSALSLSASPTQLSIGNVTTLTVTGQNVPSSDYLIIYNETTGQVVGTSQSTPYTVTQTESTAQNDTYIAYINTNSQTSGAYATSNPVTVSWYQITLTASPTYLPVNNASNLVATAQNIPSGYVLEIVDQTTGATIVTAEPGQTTLNALQTKTDVETDNYVAELVEPGNPSIPGLTVAATASASGPGYMQQMQPEDTPYWNSYVDFYNQSTSTWSGLGGAYTGYLTGSELLNVAQNPSTGEIVVCYDEDSAGAEVWAYSPTTQQWTDWGGYTSKNSQHQNLYWNAEGIVYDPVLGEMVVAFSRGGLVITEDYNETTDTWSMVGSDNGTNSLTGATQCMEMVWDSQLNEIVMGTAGPNVSIYNPSIQDWQSIGDPVSDTEALPIAVNPNTGVIYAGTQNWSDTTMQGGMYQYNSTTKTWTSLGDPGSDQSVTPFVDPATNQLYAETASHGFYEYNAPTSAWTQITTPSSTGQLEYDSTTQGLLLYTSTDVYEEVGTTWENYGYPDPAPQATDASRGIGFYYTSPSSNTGPISVSLQQDGNGLSMGAATGVTAITTNNNITYAGTQGFGVQQLASEGTNWTPVGNLPGSADYVNGLTTFNGNIYAATDTGVYEWVNNAWTLVGANSSDVTMVTSFNNSLYAVLGGEAYVDQSGTWTAVKGGTSNITVLSSGTGPLYGSVSSTSSSTIYEIVNDAWTQATTVAANVSQMAYTNGVLYMFATDSSNVPYVYSWNGSQLTNTGLAAELSAPSTSFTENSFGAGNGNVFVMMKAKSNNNRQFAYYGPSQGWTVINGNTILNGQNSAYSTGINVQNNTFYLGEGNTVNSYQIPTTTNSSYFPFWNFSQLPSYVPTSLFTTQAQTSSVSSNAIWVNGASSQQNGTAFFQTQFTLSQSQTLTLSVPTLDDYEQVYIDGTPILQDGNAASDVGGTIPSETSATITLSPGTHQVVIEGMNDGAFTSSSPSAAGVSLIATSGGSTIFTTATSTTWTTTGYITSLPSGWFSGAVGTFNFTEYVLQPTSSPIYQQQAYTVTNTAQAVASQSSAVGVTWYQYQITLTANPSTLTVSNPTTLTAVVGNGVPTGLHIVLINQTTNEVIGTGNTGSTTFTTTWTEDNPITDTFVADLYNSSGVNQSSSNPVQVTWTNAQLTLSGAQVYHTSAWLANLQQYNSYYTTVDPSLVRPLTDFWAGEELMFEVVPSIKTIEQAYVTISGLQFSSNVPTGAPVNFTGQFTVPLAYNPATGELMGNTDPNWEPWFQYLSNGTYTVQFFVKTQDDQVATASAPFTIDQPWVSGNDPSTYFNEHQTY